VSEMRSVFRGEFFFHINNSQREGAGFQKFISTEITQNGRKRESEEERKVTLNV
jgi:hypothetical protein